MAGFQTTLKKRLRRKKWPVANLRENNRVTGGAHVEVLSFEF